MGLGAEGVRVHAALVVCLLTLSLLPQQTYASNEMTDDELMAQYEEYQKNAAKHAADTEQETSALQQTLTTQNAVVGLIFVFTLLGVGGGLFYFWHKKNSVDLEAGDPQLREWVYQSADGQIGPLSNVDMKRIFQAGEIDRTTHAKVVWWEGEFRPIGELFPVPGSEFLVTAQGSGTKWSNDWHTYSKHGTKDLLNADEVNTLSWKYISPDGSEQGPFENGKMRHWFVSGYFMADLQVQCATLYPDKWSKLCETFPKIDKAFLTIPTAPKDGGEIIPIGKPTCTGENNPFQDATELASDEPAMPPIDGAAAMAPAAPPGNQAAAPEAATPAPVAGPDAATPEEPGKQTTTPAPKKSGASSSKKIPKKKTSAMNSAVDPTE